MKVKMGIVSKNGLFLLCFILVLAAYSGHSSASDINEKIGNRVDLKGTAISTDSIYLFVTGPGLPSNGVRLDDMKVPVITGDPESFTVTDVTNDHWSFTWNTARQGFSLKEGIYTVYAVKKPVGKSGVNSAVYGTISISLTKSGDPYTSTGTVFINTTPIASEIFIDGLSVGNTPQTRGLTEGDHEIRLERPGYLPIAEKLSVTPGSFVSVQRTMITETTLEVTTTLPSVTVTEIPTTGPVTPINPATTKKAQLSTLLNSLGLPVALIAMGIRKKP
jgi:hypothetical protein